MKKTVLCLLSVLLVAFQVSTQADVSIEGGYTDCGYWMRARQQNRAIALENYVLGYLDGASVGYDREFWGADGRIISREAVYSWMDNYCRSNPLNLIIPGLWKLFEERAKK